jgi:hypothetical protein
LLPFALLGLRTVICKTPGWAMSDAKMVAVSCNALTKVVARGLPLTSTSMPTAKLLPVTVRANAGPPAVTEEGLMEVMVCAQAWLQDPNSTRAGMAKDKTPLDRFTRCSPSRPCQGRGFTAFGHWALLIAHWALFIAHSLAT